MNTLKHQITITQNECYNKHPVDMVNGVWVTIFYRKVGVKGLVHKIEISSPAASRQVATEGSQCTGQILVDYDMRYLINGEPFTNSEMMICKGTTEYRIATVINKPLYI
jgi:hypothetical protein